MSELQRAYDEFKNKYLKGLASNKRLEILRGLEDDIDVSIYAEKGFNAEQIHQIYWGIRQRVDVSIYAIKEFNAEQMEQIRNVLLCHLDVSQVLDIHMPAEVMIDKFSEMLEAERQNPKYAKLGNNKK